MKIHQVKQCCCGCSLEAGTKIIAWLQIISGVLLTASSIGLIVIDSQNPNFGMFVAYIVIGILYTILGAMLLVGATKRRAHLLNVWVVVALVLIGLYAIGSVIQIVLTMVAGHFGAGIGVLVTSLIAILISYYYIMVVSSFRSEIMSGNNGV